MLNPDGHVYIEQGNDWRRNRRPTTGGNIGVDLNRNWGYQFGVDGATSDDPASEVYHGPYAFSENETVALRDLALRQRFSTSLSYHAVASLILYPWGWTTQRAPDYLELKAMAETMAAWNGYTPQQSCDLYFTHGDSEDWFYGNTSTLAFTIELDTAFHPDPSQIPISCALNREPTLYLIGYPNSSIVDAGVFQLISPFNNTIIDPDKELNISARVMNYGSFEQDIPVEVEVVTGNQTFTNSTLIHLRPGQVGTASCGWFPPLTAAENCTVKVRTNLIGDNITWNDARTAGFRIKAKYGAGIEADNTSQSCYPGQSGVFPLSVRSLSNREDSILLETVGAKSGWASVPASVQVPPAGRSEVNLTVNVPRDALPGDTASISVRAFSSTGQGASGAVSTVTRVLDPAPTAEAGPDLFVNVTKEAEFDGSLSRTPAGTLVNYTWDLGDGMVMEGAKVAYAYQKRGLYTVNLTVTNDLGWQGQDSLNVTVLQSFKLDLWAENASVRLLPGETVPVDLRLRNEGNGPDTVDITLDALKWNATIDAATILLAAGEARNIRLNITAPAGSLAGASALFRVTAVSCESTYTRDELMLTATVRAVHDLSLNLSERARNVDGGQSAAFTAVFRNGGNIEENATLSAADIPEGWTVVFSKTDLLIAPWNSTSARVTVSVPYNALAGLYHFHINGLPATVVVNPRYGIQASADIQNAAVLPGAYAFFNLTIKNGCNSPAMAAAEVRGLPPNWTISGAGMVELEFGANRTVPIGIRPPRNAKAGIYTLGLEVSLDPDPNQTRTIEVQVEVLKVKQTAPEASAFSPLIIIIISVVLLSVVGVGVYYVSKRDREPPPEAEFVPPPR